jgi:hypothetical protein
MSVEIFNDFSLKILSPSGEKCLRLEFNLGPHTQHASTLTNRPIQTDTGPGPLLWKQANFFLNNLIFLITYNIGPEPALPTSACNDLMVRVLMC